MIRNCQVCGEPIFSRDNLGTNQDGTFSRDFCSSCYRDGEFTVRKDQGQGQDRTGIVGLAFPFTGAGGTGSVMQPYFPPVFFGSPDQTDNEGY